MLVLGAVMAVEKNVSWGRKIGTPLGVILVGSGLMLGAAPALQTPTTVEVALVPGDGSSVTGTATFTDASGGVEVALDVGGLPDPGKTYLAHIHPGSCIGEPARTGEDHAHGHHHGNADEPADKIEHPLRPVVLDAWGDGSSDTLIKGVTVTQLFSGEPGLYTNVHAESSGSEEMPASVVCGDLRKSG
jgi:hypothetical protein